MKTRYLTALLLSLFCAFGIQLTPSSAGSTLISGTFVKGMNLPWLDGAYDHDIGTNPINASTCVYNHAHMNQYLAAMHAMGVSVVRIWLMENEQGLMLDSNGNVTALQPTFLSNLDDIVALAKANNVSLYLTLLNGDDDFENYLTNSTTQAAFVNNAVIPLASRYKGNASIFAFDAMNEIDSMVANTQPDSNGVGHCTWVQAQGYMQSVAAAIHGADPTRLVSCSTGWAAWYNLSYFKGQGLDFYDFHEYKDDPAAAASNPTWYPALPTASSLNMDKPILIGECGQYTSTWSDTIQTNCIMSFLNSARANGYAGVLPWDYGVSEYPSPGPENQDYLSVNTWNYDSDGNVISLQSARPVCALIQAWPLVDDFNGDGHPDYLLFNASSLQTAVWYLNGSSLVSAASGPGVPAGWSIVGTADFNGDGYPDLLLFHASDLKTYIWYMNGATAIGSAPGPTLPAGWSIAGVGDFNGDGKPDLFLLHASDLKTYVWYMNNTSVITSAPGPTLPTGWSIAGLADFNGDGKPDLLFFNPTTLKTYVWYLNNTSVITTAPGPTAPTGWTVAGAADFNGDGQPDLLFFHPSDLKTYIWYMNGLTPASTAPGPTLPAGWGLAAP